MKRNLDATGRMAVPKPQLVRRGRLTIRWISMFFIAGSVGACGGESTESTPPAVVRTVTVPLSPEVAALKLYVPPTPAAPDIARAAQVALTRGGYMVSGDRRVGDVTVQIAASVAPVPSAEHVQVNGVERVMRHYSVTVSILAGGQVIEHASTEFEADGVVSPGRLLPIVAALNASTRLVQFARIVQSRRANEANEAEKNRLAAEEANARVEEETTWNAARVTGCELPISLTGCDAVRIYLAKYPEGAHVEEAKKAISAGEPQLLKLQKDENAWQQAGVAACRSHSGTEPCLGVELYLAKYQAGLHADEARALLDASALPVSAPPAAP